MLTLSRTQIACTSLSPQYTSAMTVDTELFQLVASSALQGLLDRIVGPKTLILTPSLAGPLGLVTEVGLLKVSSHGPYDPAESSDCAPV